VTRERCEKREASWFRSLGWLNEINQMNQIGQMNQPNQMNQSCVAVSRLAGAKNPVLYFLDLPSRRGA
jgi:hypothetical protein